MLLTHGMSRAVMEVLKYAAQSSSKRFHVIITEGRPDGAGYVLAAALAEVGIPSECVLDSAMGVALERADMVLVGAESVVESGGVVNKVGAVRAEPRRWQAVTREPLMPPLPAPRPQIGTYPLAICAKVLKKPVYVVAESYKFTRMFPLGHGDIPPDTVAYSPCSLVAARSSAPYVPHAKALGERSPVMEALPREELRGPRIDYTPAQFITLLFTDLGVLTPAAVSDELIKLYEA